MSTSSYSIGWPILYLEYFFHIKLDLRLVIVDRNKLHFTSFKKNSFAFRCVIHVFILGEESVEIYEDR